MQNRRVHVRRLWTAHAGRSTTFEEGEALEERLVDGATCTGRVCCVFCGLRRTRRGEIRVAGSTWASKPGTAQQPIGEYGRL